MKLALHLGAKKCAACEATHCACAHEQLESLAALQGLTELDLHVCLPCRSFSVLAALSGLASLRTLSLVLKTWFLEGHDPGWPVQHAFTRAPVPLRSRGRQQPPSCDPSAGSQPAEQSDVCGVLPQDYRSPHHSARLQHLTSLCLDGDSDTDLDWVGALPHLLPHAQVDFVLQEIGTCPPLTVLHALREENRWHFYGDGSLHHPVKLRFREALCPANVEWRGKAVTRGVTLARAAARWTFSGRNLA